MFALASIVLAAALSPAPADSSAGRPASCAVENQPAAIREGDVPDYPASLQAMHLGGTTAIRVDLAPDGHLIRASINKSSGYVMLDDAALRGARLMAYTPETVACKNVGGSYLVDVVFDPDQS